jgi:mRNA-degrading endonuclease RelE of RelBE toxin-antitoxin system
MSYNIETTSVFDKQAKRLAKKHPSIKSDLIELGKSLAENPTQGSALGNNFYKVRMAIKSKNKGKSGGARVITFVKVIDSTVFLATIYDKSEFDNLSAEAIEGVFKSFLN